MEKRQLLIRIVFAILSYVLIMNRCSDKFGLLDSLLAELLNVKSSKGTSPAARGVPQIEVTFDIDTNGIFSVAAKDEATNKQQSITISGASTLPKAEVERMVKDAEANASADKEKFD